MNNAKNRANFGYGYSYEGTVANIYFSVNRV
jgi:hypothetical protein